MAQGATMGSEVHIIEYVKAGPALRALAPLTAPQERTTSTLLTLRFGPDSVPLVAQQIAQDAIHALRREHIPIRLDI
jgi:hypothetical protein